MIKNPLHVSAKKAFSSLIIIVNNAIPPLPLDEKMPPEKVNQVFFVLFLE